MNRKKIAAEFLPVVVKFVVGLDTGKDLAKGVIGAVGSIIKGGLGSDAEAGVDQVAQEIIDGLAEWLAEEFKGTPDSTAEAIVANTRDLIEGSALDVDRLLALDLDPARARDAACSRIDSLGLSNDPIRTRVESFVGKFFAKFVEAAPEIREVRSRISRALLERSGEIMRRLEVLVRNGSLNADEFAALDRELTRRRALGLIDPQIERWSPERQGRPPADAARARANILLAKYRVVPFTDRDDLVNDIIAWCQAPHARDMRVYRGDGGIGKSRAMIEVAARLRDGHGWQAGFLPRAAAHELFGQLAECSPRLLLVLDEANHRVEDAAALIAAARQVSSGHRLRLVLLARDLGEWWQQLRTANDGVMEFLREIDDPLASRFELHPLAPDPARRPERVRVAVDALKEALGLTGHATIAIDTSDEVLDHPLYLGLTVLAALDGRTPRGAEELLDFAVQREELAWRAACPIGTPLAPLFGAFPDAVAVITLAGGATREEVDRLLSAIPVLHDQPVATRLAIANELATLYPGRDVAPLRPDPLGEHLVATVFEKPPSRLAGIVGNLFSSDPGITNRLIGRLPDRTLRLREAAAMAVETYVAGLRRVVSPDSPRFQSTLARALGRLAIRLSDLGRLEEALSAAREANYLCQKWSRALPDAVEPDLASSLLIYANRLSKMGRRSEALEAANDAIRLYRKLALERPEAFQPDLAGSLASSSVMLSELGRSEDALAAAKEAIGLFRDLSHMRPSAFVPQMAASLSNCAIMFAALGRRDEAVEAAREAVELCRELAWEHPDASRADLATALNYYADALGSIGEHEQAIAAALESTDLFRVLMLVRPNVFSGDFATALNGYAIGLSNLGRHEDAFQAAQEACDTYRRLAQIRPEAVEPHLAGLLTNCAVMLKDLGRCTEALEPALESVQLFRKLTKTLPEAYGAKLATALGNCSIILKALSRFTEATEMASEALNLRRSQAKAQPDAFEAELGISLSNYANCLGEAGLLQDASVVAREAIDLHRKLARAHPNAYEPALATSLHNSATTLIRLGRERDAVAELQEACSLYRKLALERPEAHEPNLAVALSALSWSLVATGELAEADRSAREAAEILRPHFLKQPVAHVRAMIYVLQHFGDSKRSSGIDHELFGPIMDKLRELGVWRDDDRPAGG